MSVIPHQLVTLRLVRRRQLSNSLVCYAKVIIILTFVLAWTRLLLFWKKKKLPKGYRKLSPNPSLVDGLVNPIPSSVSLVDHVVNLVSSSIEPQTQVVDPVPSLIIPTLNQKSVTQVVDIFSSLVDPTLPLESDTKAIDLFPPVNPIIPLENETQVVDLVLSSVDPTRPLTSAKVVDPVPLFL
jgi:hypothetical protein